MIALLLTWAALAAEPECAAGLEAPPSELSVAWVSRLGKTVGRRGWLDVVRTADLRRLVQANGGGVARTLQVLGMRRSAREPARRFKITVFDVRRDDLCRPVADVEEGAAVAGVGACADRHGRAGRSRDGCGLTVDRSGSGPGIEVFRVRWDDAARNGFCVLPVERFLQAAAR